MVYANMIQGERDQDPDRAGVAVVIDVEDVAEVGAGGPSRCPARPEIRHGRRGRLWIEEAAGRRAPINFWPRRRCEATRCLLS
jgi:hypothetical protein